MSLPSQDLLSAFEYCRRIQEKYGKSYYFATRFFPIEKRMATYALYAFFRIPDEIVDTKDAQSEEFVRERLLSWQKEWRRAYAGQGDVDPVLKAASWVFHQYQIPFEYGERFFSAMIQDTEKSVYETYAELEEYMYGSAAVVGLMMSHVIGFQDAVALNYARKLGEAMQITNFLRDVREDYEERGRIYLPVEDMRRFGVTVESIAEFRFDSHFRELMRFEISRADQLYEEVNVGIPLLHQDGRFAVRTASLLYRQILRKIESVDYNVFKGRVRTSLLEKVLLTIRAL